MAKRILFAVCLLLMAGSVLADGPPRQVPLLFNYQGVLTDEGGNPLPDGILNLKFEILNSSGAALYKEGQDAEIVNGQVSAIIGNGLDPATGAPTGGIPAEAFDPTDTHYLQVEAEGQKPYDRLEIVAQPYAIWSSTALGLAEGALTGAMVGEKVIEKKHLSDELMSDLKAEFEGMMAENSLSQDSFKEFKTVVQASSGASQIGVASNFVYSGAKTVQGVLSDMDKAIKKRQEEVDFAKKDYEAKVANEAATRKNSDDALQKNIDNEASARSNADAGEVGLRTAGDNSLQNQLNSHAVTTSTHGVSGNIVGTTDIQTLTNKALNGGSIINNIIVNSGKTIDGVDISAHNHGGSGQGGTIWGTNAAIWSHSDYVPDQTSLVIPSHFNIAPDCGATVSLASLNVSDGVDILCVKRCADIETNRFIMRCRMSSDNPGYVPDPCTYLFPAGDIGTDKCEVKPDVITTEPCYASYRVFCAK